MKQIFTLGIISLFLTASNAQTTKQLFTDCGITQVFDFYYDTPDPIKQSIRYQRDTIIDDLEHMVISLNVNLDLPPNTGDYFFRVEGQKVFYKNRWHDPDNFSSPTEWLYYDFSAEVGETVVTQSISQPGFLHHNASATVVEKSIIQLMDGVDRIRMVLELGNSGRLEWIEGIGNAKGGLFRPDWRMNEENLMDCISNINGTIWIDEEFTEEQCEAAKIGWIDEPLECESTLSSSELEVNHFSIYPNPASDQLVIENNYSSPVSLFIYDVLGNQVLTKKMTSSITQIDCSDLNFGYYMIQILNEQGNLVQTEKLVLSQK